MNEGQRGQVMIVTVIALTIASLAAMVVSATLTLQQLKQARAIQDSAKAIYAADSGIEYELYEQFVSSIEFAKPSMTNGADFTTSLSPGNIKSVGQALNSVRAFQVFY